jgi:hypothetical protein
MSKIVDGIPLNEATHRLDNRKVFPIQKKIVEGKIIKKCMFNVNFSPKKKLQLYFKQTICYIAEVPTSTHKKHFVPKLFAVFFNN